MFSEKIEQAFHLTEQAIQLLQQALDTSFLEAYIENGENQLDNFQVNVLDGTPKADEVQKLTTLYQQLQAIALEPEEFRRLSQLLLLKGSRQDGLQPNHQLTPDSLGFLFVYLIEQLHAQTEPLKVLDLSVGMGNLLLTVVLNLHLAKYQVMGYGVDIDETLLEVASVNAALSNAPIQLFHQDGLQGLLVEPADFVISDLPVGFYPQDQKAASFKVAANEGHTYAHHLLMEQAMNSVKEDGYGIFLVPANLLQSEQSELLKGWLKEQVYVQAMIQLPEALFKSEQSRKSILVLQRKGSTSQQAKEVLVAQLTSLKEPQKLTQFFQQFESWKSSNLK